MAVRSPSLLDSFFGDPFALDLRPVARPSAGRTPLGTTASVTRRDGRVHVAVDLPGVRAEDVGVRVTPDAGGAVVSVAATRVLPDGERSFRWSTRLAGVDADSLAADLTDGVLTLSADDTTAAEPRSVAVTSGGAPALATPAEPVDTGADGEPSGDADDAAEDTTDDTTA